MKLIRPRAWMIALTAVSVSIHSPALHAQQAKGDQVAGSDSGYVVIVIPSRGEPRVMRMPASKADLLSSIAAVLVPETSLPSVTGSSPLVVAADSVGAPEAATPPKTQIEDGGRATRRELLMTLVSHVILALLLP